MKWCHSKRREDMVKKSVAAALPKNGTVHAKQTWESRMSRASACREATRKTRLRLLGTPKPAHAKHPLQHAGLRLGAGMGLAISGDSRYSVYLQGFLARSGSGNLRH